MAKLTSRFAISDDGARLPDPVAHPTMDNAVERLCTEVFTDGPPVSTILKREIKHIAALKIEDLSNWVETRIEVNHNGNSMVLHTTIGPGWDGIDALMVWRQEDSDNRYKAGYSWRNNSCATDALIALAIQLDAWRVRADQYLRHRSQNLAVHWLRNIASSPWGLMTTAQRAALRDELQKILAGLSRNYSKAGEMRDCIETYKHLFAQLPQVSSTTLRLSWCCNQKSLQWDRFRERNIYLSGWATGNSKQADTESFTSLLQDVFAEVKDDCNQDDKCCQGTQIRCKSKVSQTVLVGRLAPIIVIDAARDHKMFDMQDPGLISLKYLRLNPADMVSETQKCPKVCTAQYRLAAIIYLREKHYFLESSIRGERVHVDMLDTKKFGPSKCAEGSWQCGEARVELVVFKLCLDKGAQIDEASWP